MSIKEKFESHPVVFGLTLIVIGYVAGFSSRGYFPSESYPAQKLTICQVENINSLENNHGQRILNFQEKLMELERQITDRNIISFYQEKYMESAERIRNDIAKENENYQSAMRQLNLRCKEA